MADYAWYPHPGPQTAFCESWQDEVLFGGAAGPGKTDCLVMEASRFVTHPDYHALLARRTFPMLQEVIDRTRKYYPLIGGDYRAGEHRWYFPSGAHVTLGHCQHDGDEYNYQGKEYQYIGLDEAGQFLPTQILYLFSRCRSTVPEIPKRLRYGSNPGGPAHQFLKDRFRIGQHPEGGITIYEDVEIELAPGVLIRERLARAFVPGRLVDNPTLLHNDPGYVARLYQLPAIERMRLLHGIWDAFEGQAFPELNRDVHGVDPFDVPPEWPRYRTFDWGSGAPFSVGWWAVDPEGDLYRYREWYGAKKDENTSVWIGLRMSNAEIARGILERERDASGRPEKVKPGPADPSIWSKRRDKKTGAIGIPIAQELAAEGVTFVQANNERIHGRQQVHSRLRVDPDPAHPDQPGHPKIYTFNNLEHWWRTMLNLRNDTRNIEDVDTDQEDHVYDETRYMCMYKPLRPQVAKPSDANTFQGERRRYIQAKKLAARMGISLERAYRMVR